MYPKMDVTKFPKIMFCSTKFVIIVSGNNDVMNPYNRHYFLFKI